MGISQARLAQMLGVTRSACSQWESKGGTAPRRERLLEIAELLGVSYLWLSTGKGAPENGIAEPRPRYPRLTAEERQLLKLYGALSPEARRSLLAFLAAL